MGSHSVLAVGINIAEKEKKIIQKNLKQDDIILHTASIKDILLRIKDGHINMQIKDKQLDNYEYVWIQSGWSTAHMAYLLDLYLTLKNIPHNKTNISITKLSDIFILSSKGISVPNTYYHNGLKVNSNDIRDIEDICNFPCIYKKSKGSLGDGVYLIDKAKDIIQTIMEKREFNRYIFQEYIPNDFDYRIVIANEIPISICKRTRVNDEFRNNSALGAIETFHGIREIPRKTLNIAIEAAKALNLDWAGVDVVTDKNTRSNYILEVNRRPGLTEESTESLAAYTYIKTLVGR